MEIINKTKRPLRIPLPAGKKLFLNPGKSGQILPGATDYPPLVKLIEAGDVEVIHTGRGHKSGPAGGGSKGISGGSDAGGSGGIRHFGDR